MRKGDIVLVSFPFTDFSGYKIRPALVLYVSSRDVILSFITSQIQVHDTFDVLVTPSTENKLKKTSLIKLSKCVTIDKRIMLGLLGTLEKENIELINSKLIISFTTSDVKKCYFIRNFSPIIAVFTAQLSFAH
jgi:mRNA interferase MazF